MVAGHAGGSTVLVDRNRLRRHRSVHDHHRSREHVLVAAGHGRPAVTPCRSGQERTHGPGQGGCDLQLLRRQPAAQVRPGLSSTLVGYDPPAAQVLGLQHHRQLVRSPVLRQWPRALCGHGPHRRQSRAAQQRLGLLGQDARSLRPAIRRKHGQGDPAGR